jgi:hypothetical protein
MIQQGQTTAFKLSLYQNYFLNSGYTFYIALYTANATALNNTLLTYSPVNEVTGVGYTAGGVPLTVQAVSFDSTTGTAFVTFNNPSWAPASFTTRAALIYNSTVGNAAIAVLDFGASISAQSTFTITMPGATASTALLRSS